MSRVGAAAWVVVSTLVALGISEGLLRWALAYPQPQFMRVDAELGHSHRPSVSGFHTREGFAHVSINRHGMRDGDYPLEKGPKKRLALLGDSYTEAFQVELAETYHGLLESAYRDQIEVLNFGVGGYSTAQQLLTYQQVVRPFKPDWVVLALYPGNDIQENSQALSGDFPRPYFVLDGDRLTLDDRFRDSPKLRRASWVYEAYYYLTDHFLLASLLDQLRYRVTREEAAQQGIAGPDLVDGSNILYAPNAPLHREAWTLTERLILEIADSVRADGAEFLLFVLDSMPAQAQTRLDRLYAENRLDGLCRTWRLRCAFMAPVALAYSEINATPLHGFDGKRAGHWNQTGHRVAAEVLRGALVQAGFLNLDTLSRR